MDGNCAISSRPAPLPLAVVFLFTNPKRFADNDTKFIAHKILFVAADDRFAVEYQNSNHETWLWDSYLIATSNAITQHCFREGSINRFNVLCFRDSSQMQFYDDRVKIFLLAQCESKKSNSKAFYHLLRLIRI